jgi:acyl carrier protein
MRNPPPSEGLSAQVRGFLLKKFPLARKRQLTNSDALLESGILDSQSVLEVVGFIEKQFSIHVEDDELVPENFQNIDAIVRFVESRVCRNA